MKNYMRPCIIRARMHFICLIVFCSILSGLAPVKSAQAALINELSLNTKQFYIPALINGEDISAGFFEVLLYLDVSFGAPYRFEVQAIGPSAYDLFFPGNSSAASLLSIASAVYTPSKGIIDIISVALSLTDITSSNKLEASMTMILNSSIPPQLQIYNFSLDGEVLSNAPVPKFLNLADNEIIGSNSFIADIAVMYPGSSGSLPVDILLQKTKIVLTVDGTTIVKEPLGTFATVNDFGKTSASDLYGIINIPVTGISDGEHTLVATLHWEPLASYKGAIKTISVKAPVAQQTIQAIAFIEKIGAAFGLGTGSVDQPDEFNSRGLASVPLNKTSGTINGLEFSFTSLPGGDLELAGIVFSGTGTLSADQQMVEYIKIDYIKDGQEWVSFTAQNIPLVSSITNGTGNYLIFLADDFEGCASLLDLSIDGVKVSKPICTTYSKLQVNLVLLSP